jgi:hypothetical protein
MDCGALHGVICMGRDACANAGDVSLSPPRWSMGLRLIQGFCSVKPFLNEIFKTQRLRNEILLAMTAFIFKTGIFSGFIKIGKLKESF